jgi:sulfur transfer protein SufE
MNRIDPFLIQPQHSALVEEYWALENAEDKLMWLMERPPLHRPVLESECTTERRVPGCLSGLWLQAESKDGLCFFSCRSESEVVHGIGSLLCDLYSNRPALEIEQICTAFATALKLDGLLTLTRRRTVSTIVGFILQYAASSAVHELHAPEQAA